ncbi:MAG: CDP-glycerol glycerophosphotransferase family protein [Clostridia bacterium]|nr:CDP-glycerol glycerophosphotransferase family protein [Clostridia bacterium]
MDLKAVLINVTKKILRTGFEVSMKALSCFFKLFPLKKRVCFYSIRSDGELLENAKSVYDKLDCKKIVLANMLPHSHLLIVKLYYHLLTSKVIVTDDYLKYLRYVKLRKNQKVVQIWHACGAFKKFGLDAPSKLSRELEKKTHSRYDAVCVSSEFVRKFYASAFGIDEEKIIAAGVARTDRLFDKKYVSAAKENLLKKYPFAQGKKVYLYAPTFRENDGGYYHFDFGIDFEKLNELLEDDEIFVLKRHPVMKEKYFENGRYGKVFDLSDESALDLTILCDTLITDYSSVIFEAALMKKKIVFYCPDLDSYERNFYLRYPDDLPGEIVTDPEGLLGCVRGASVGRKADEFVEKELSACDGNSSQRIAGIILGYLK